MSETAHAPTLDPKRHAPVHERVLIVGLGGGMSVVKSSTTDAGGKYRVDGLPTDSPLMVRAGYKSVNYHGRVNFDASGKARVDIEVFEPTTSLQGITLAGLQMADA